MLIESIEKLASALPPQGRLLGLDVGDKTIGLALSDLSRMIATPMETLARGKFSKDLQALKTLVVTHKVQALIIGYPINMDGTLGPRCQSTRQFTKNIEKDIPLPMFLWDERMSTQAVTRMMIEADMSRQRRAEMVDKLAASYILQGALDRLKHFTP